MSTFLDLPRHRRDAPVYRFIPLHRLYELFRTRKNVLVRPECWDDPFENLMLRSQRVSRSGWFGQCWTHHRASDAMWRIYSKNSGGVRVRSTPARLLESLSQALDSRSAGFVGAVKYLSERRLNQFARLALFPANLRVPAKAAKTLLVKRLAFRHEGEIRLLVFWPVSSSDCFTYDVDPYHLIDQLMLDPRLTPGEAESAKAEIRGKTGYTGPIKRSLLYAPPRMLLLPSPNDLNPPSNRRLQPTKARRSRKR